MKFLIFSLKPVHLIIFPISVNDTPFNQLLRPKILELSLNCLFLLNPTSILATNCVDSICKIYPESGLFFPIMLHHTPNHHALSPKYCFTF